MLSRSKRKLVTADCLSSRISALFSAECYSVLKAQFNSILSFGSTNPEILSAIELILSNLEQNLVKDPKERFDFDSRIIDSISDSLSDGIAALPRTIIPCYGAEWAIAPIKIIQQKGDQRMFLISFPGEDVIEDIELEDYPWIFHEIAHLLIEKLAKSFREGFSKVVGIYTHELRKSSFADNRFLRGKTEERIELMRSHWDPKESQSSWASELAADSIALWITGPAFLAALKQAIEYRNPNPFQIDFSHPPYVIRLKAVVYSAQRLGWEHYASGLQSIIDIWKGQGADRSDHNILTDLGNSTIIHNGIDFILERCAVWKLPMMNKARLNSLKLSNSNSFVFQDAVDLIASSWISRQNKGRSYEDWQRSVISKFGDDQAGIPGS